MKAVFSKLADEEYRYWQKKDRRAREKIDNLLKDIAQHPFTGLGKPEPLRYDLAGCWSRRITKAHRLVYKVEPDKIIVVSCRFHYDK